jgi:hypothetical protein
MFGTQRQLHITGLPWDRKVLLVALHRWKHGVFWYLGIRAYEVMSCGCQVVLTWLGCQM